MQAGLYVILSIGPDGAIICGAFGNDRVEMEDVFLSDSLGLTAPLKPSESI